MLKSLNSFTQFYFWAAKRFYISVVEGLPRKQRIFDWKKDQIKRAGIINKLIEFHGYKNYLEIGCFDNINFNQISALHKVGVDPVSGGTHRMTSDEFFKDNKEKFDIVFIDGLHTYEQVRKDFYNSLRFLAKGGTIVFHDMLPASWWQERVPRLSRLWNGTVWKIAYEAKQLFGDKFGIISVDQGVGVVFNDVEVPASQREYYGNKKYSDFLTDYPQFNIVPVPQMESFLKERRYGPSHKRR